MEQVLRPHKTLGDFLALDEDVRAEFIGGEILVTPLPNVPHQRAVGALSVALSRWCRGRGGGEAFVGPLGVFLPSGDVVAPDVVYVAPDQRRLVHHDGIHGAPALLVEVVSPSHPERDLLVKRTLYAENGVREYWIVHPDERAVEVLRLARGAWQPAGWFQRHETLVSTSLPGFALALAEAFPEGP